MGPAIAVKAVIPNKFSLLIFGWSQILIDMEPLIFHLTGQGGHHGLTHNFLGATFLAIFSAITGRYLLNIGAQLPGIKKILAAVNWRIAMLSAFIGDYSHVLFDALVHEDVTPFAPFDLRNPLSGFVSLEAMNLFCIFCALAGSLVYFLIVRDPAKP